MPVKKINKPVPKKTVPAKKTSSAKTDKNINDKACSFCGKSADNSCRLIAGPNDIFICDECVIVCVKILGNETGSSLCPLVSLKTHKLLEEIGSQLNRPPSERTRIKYDVLYLASKKPLSEKIYSEYVVPIAEKHKIKVKHLSEILNSKLSFNKELLDIYNALLIIADVHEQDPDIMYLLGMINLIGKPLIILLQKPEDTPKGLENERYIIYKNAEKSLSDLTTRIEPLFSAIKRIKRLTKKIRAEKKK